MLLLILLLLIQPKIRPKNTLILVFTVGLFHDFNPLTFGTRQERMVVHRLALQARQVINPKIRRIQKHTEHLSFIGFHPKVKVGSVVADVDVIGGIVHRIAVIGETRVDDFKPEGKICDSARFLRVRCVGF
jgi:hypothetical protein